jgi:threonine dehydratase
MPDRIVQAPPLSTSAVTIDTVRAAQARLAGHVENTPCLHSRTLSQITGADVYLKFENLQFTASFKERGALNKLSMLTAEQRARGVIAVSAGNHAQGVAYHAQRLGIPAVIVMPRFTPTVKVERTRGFAAEVVLTGDTFDDSKAEAARLAAERSLTMVHPYDDADVIAGQGTVALEMLAQQPDIDCLCVAIGGGGLISGVATAARALKPSIEIVGVQTDQFPSMYSAFKGVQMPSANATLAEGIAVKQPGDLTVEIVKRMVDDIGVVVRMDHRERSLRGQSRGLGLRVIEGVARQHDLRPEPAGALDLHGRREARHHDHRRNAEPLRVIGHALRVVARRHGDDAALTLRGRQRRQLVERPALLERRRELQILELQVHVGARDLGQRAGVQARRVLHVSRQARLRGADRVDRDWGGAQGDNPNGAAGHCIQRDGNPRP